MASLDEVYNRALVDHREGRLQQAAAGYGAVVAADSRAVEPLHMLGLVTHQSGDSGAALEFLRRAVGLAPNSAACHAHFGAVLAATGDLSEAEGSLRRAVMLDPARAEAVNHLADLFLQTGRLEQAIAFMRRSLTLRPGAALASKLLLLLHCQPGSTPRSLLDEHVRWDETYARPVAAGDTLPPPPCRAAGRPLRVGYVSPVLSQNPVGRFLLPLLTHHYRDSFHAYCYTDTPASDAPAAPLRQAAHAWRCTAGIDDAALARMIRADEIDILVDLAAHAEGNRLLSFARRPAPVQVTWLSYCSTTGLREMDYRLSDPFLDPAGVDLGDYTEKTVRLPHTYWCYPAHANVPRVSPAPVIESGRVTFGCLCNFVKLTRPTLDLFAQVLHALPGSRLVLPFHRDVQRSFLATEFAGRGIDAAERIRFIAALPLAEYFTAYCGIDIALDPFPYPGGTTTCDALCMGVPTVTLPGVTAVSRAGLSLLSNVGLGDLVARSPEEYVSIACSLARDAGRVPLLRSTLRQRLLKSPLMDGNGFARDVEHAYRHMWAEKWAGESARFRGMSIV